VSEEVERFGRVFGNEFHVPFDRERTREVGNASVETRGDDSGREFREDGPDGVRDGPACRRLMPRAVRKYEMYHP
jgi:hypothetical protein